MKRILSISGGGIRGLIPAIALAAMEKQFGKSVRDVVDYIGGCSTGALQSAVFAAGVPASTVVDFYVKQGPKIFAPRNSVARTIKLVAGGYQFDNKVLYAVMKEAMGKAAAWTFNDAPLPILVIVADMKGNPWFLTRDSETNAKTTGKLSILDGAVGSACATTFHGAWNIPNFGWAYDGGTAGFADPVMRTCIEAFRGYRCYGEIDPKDALVISLGTGFYNPPAMPAPPSGLLQGVEWVTGSLVGNSETTAQQDVERMWPGVLRTLDAALPADWGESDIDAIPQLVEIGQAAAAQMDWRKILGL